jgi:hypothetical protein
MENGNLWFFMADMDPNNSDQVKLLDEVRRFASQKGYRDCRFIAFSKDGSVTTSDPILLIAPPPPPPDATLPPNT